MRISSACELTPRGVFKVRLEEEQEENGFEEIEKEEEIKREKLEFYLKTENWLHLVPEITENGRSTREEFEFAEEVDEETKENLKKQLAKLVQPSRRLKPISQDKSSEKMAKSVKCWLAMIVGNQTEHLHPISGKLVSTTVLHLKSTVWPGFNLFYKDGEVFRVYIGTGEKYQVGNYFPKLTHNIQMDPETMSPMSESSAPEKTMPVEDKNDE